MAVSKARKNTMYKQCLKNWKSNSTIIVILLFCVVVMQYLILIGNDCGDVRATFEQQAPEVGTTEQTATIPPNSTKSTVECLHDTTQKPESETVSNSDDKSNTYDLDNCTCGVHFRLDSDRVSVFPTRTDGHKKFLTIGIPTIKRREEMYLIDTVNSLLSNMNDVEQNDTIIVIMLADNTAEQQQYIQEQMEKHFQNFIEQGVIHIIKPPLGYYSSLKVLKTTHKQGKDYIKWRSKQNFDYAFLMRYSAPLSHYYLQLEDDVISAKGFVFLIRTFIRNQTTFWSCLEFSELGFIGKLFKTQDLEQLSQLLLLFYQEQPGDEIFLLFNLLMTQDHRKVFAPSLFQHKGIFSSFPGKIQTLQDRFWETNETVGFQNPTAKISTSLKQYLNYAPLLAYDGSSNFFWSQVSPKVGDIFTIHFYKPQTVSRVIIQTGLKERPKDIIEKGALFAGSVMHQCKLRMECSNEVKLGDLIKGSLDTSGIEKKVNFKVQCLEIEVLKSQRQWVIIRNILVYVA